MRRQIKEPIVMRRVMAPSSVCICLLVEPSCCSHIESFSQSDLAKDGTWTCMASSNLKSQLGMPANGSVTSSTALQKGARAWRVSTAFSTSKTPRTMLQHPTWKTMPWSALGRMLSRLLSTAPSPKLMTHLSLLLSLVRAKGQSRSLIAPIQKLNHSKYRNYWLSRLLSNQSLVPTLHDGAQRATNLFT